MSTLIQELCPSCQKPVEVTPVEVENQAPGYCGWCGAQLHTSCPACGSKLPHLFAFCPRCRAPLTEKETHPGSPAGADAPPRPKAAEPEGVASLRRDLAAMIPLWRTTLEALIELNPVTLRGNEFAEQVAHITNDTSPAQDLASLRRAIDYGDLTAIGESMEAFAAAIVRATDDLTTGWFPSLAASLKLHTAFSIEPSFRASLLAVLRSQKERVEELQAGVQALREGLPRCQKIASSSHVWQFVGGIALGLIAGEAATDLATGLQQAKAKSDQEYLQAFQSTMNRVVSEWAEFQPRLAQAVAPALDRIFSSLEARCEELFSELTALSAKGQNLTAERDSLRLAWHPNQPFEQEICNDVITALERIATDSETVERIRSLLDRGRALNLTEWPELSTRHQHSVRRQKEQEWVLQIRGLLGDSIDRCYLMPNIPEAKLQAALTSYAHGVDPNRILLLYDDTVWGGSKDGFCLTLEELCWHDLGGQVHGRSLRGIDTIRRGQGAKIEVDGLDLSVSLGSPDKILAVLQFARDCAKAPFRPANAERKAA